MDAKANCWKVVVYGSNTGIMMDKDTIHNDVEIVNVSGTDMMRCIDCGTHTMTYDEAANV